MNREITSTHRHEVKSESILFFYFLFVLCSSWPKSKCSQQKLLLHFWLELVLPTVSVDLANERTSKSFGRFRKKVRINIAIDFARANGEKYLPFSSHTRRRHSRSHYQHVTELLSGVVFKLFFVSSKSTQQWTNTEINMKMYLTLECICKLHIMRTYLLFTAALLCPPYCLCW